MLERFTSISVSTCHCKLVSLCPGHVAMLAQNLISLIPKLHAMTTTHNTQRNLTALFFFSLEASPDVVCLQQPSKII